MEKIRSAELKDIEQVYKLISELENRDLGSDRFKKIYIENINNPNVFYYVYDVNEMIVGFISVHIQSLLHHAAHIAEIQEFIIRKNIRGNGLGIQLFNKAVEIAKENDCDQIEVCCNQNRKSSHLFYQNRGMLNNHFKFFMSLK